MAQTSRQTILDNLRAEKADLELGLERVTRAIAVLETGEATVSDVARTTTDGRSKGTRRLSAAGRAAISAAAKKRWAKVRAAKKKTARR